VAAADRDGMAAARAEAEQAAVEGEVPVGAVVMRGGEIIARARNAMRARRDPTAHAELLAIQAALAAQSTDRLGDATLYVTLEPCAQCAGAILLGAWDDKAGMAGSVHDLLRHPRLNHRPEVIGGVMADQCGELLRDFFRERR
jgi:tRNA(adenine34) deaminase